MNSKRWIAIGIAIALFLVWGLVQGTKVATDRNFDELFAQDSIKETVIEARDSSEKIALLTIDGTIASGGQETLFSGPTYNHAFFMTQLNEILEDTSVKGVLLEVNTPGGGVYESAEIAKGLTEIQEQRKIPIYVSMKTMAASGGYYVSAKADKIYAAEETMTGSIGVIMSGLNMSGLLEKLGVTDETVKSGELKDIGSTTRKWTDKDRQVMQEMIDSSYDRFVTIISEGRGMSDEDVRKIADGRIYDGVQAHENGLVDELGYQEDALADLRKEYKLKNATLFQYELPTFSMMDSFLGANVQKIFNKKESETEIISNLIRGFGSNEAPRMMYLYGGE